MRIVVTGGGTAGHISPILAVVDALNQRADTPEILYIGQRTGLEARMAREAGLAFAGISAGKYRRVPGASLRQHLSDPESLLLNLRDSGRIAAAYFQSLQLLRRFKPDMVFAKGGFVGLPVAVAAKTLGIPVLIHESDVMPGLGNKIVSRWARQIAVGFPPEAYRELPAEKLVFTGNPIRKETLSGSKQEGIGYFFGKKSSNKPVLMVIGGSQGAHALNRAVMADSRQILESTRIIHITGQYDYNLVQDQVASMGTESTDYCVRDFLNAADLGLAYAASDLVVSRAGANTIAELAALKKPTILIPNRTMAAHQLVNASRLHEAGAVHLLPEEKLNEGALYKTVMDLLGSPDKLSKMGDRIADFNVSNAAERLADLICRIALQGRQKTGISHSKSGDK